DDLGSQRTRLAYLGSRGYPAGRSFSRPPRSGIQPSRSGLSADAPSGRLPVCPPQRSRMTHRSVSAGDVKGPGLIPGVPPRCPLPGGNRMLEMTNENFARLLRGLTLAVGNRRNRILLYQFLAAEIRALHCSYGVGDEESYKRALTFLENCERYTLR